jgi:hypothetical protein
MLGLCVSATAAFATAPTARGDGPDVDIDSLKAEIRAVRNSDGHVEWRISVKYKVEADQPVAGDLRLSFRLTEKDELVRDPDGEPIELSIPLNQPAEVDGDEVEFRGQPMIVLPERCIHRPRSLRLHAVARGNDQEWDRKDTRIKFRLPD